MKKKIPAKWIGLITTLVGAAITFFAEDDRLKEMVDEKVNERIDQLEKRGIRFGKEEI